MPSTLAIILVSLGAVAAKDIYVSPTGTGTGTLAAPYGSIQSAVNAAVAGDTIYLRGGTYRPSANIQFSKSGTRTSPSSVRPYQSEKVIIDGENMPGTPKAVGESLPNSERGIFHIQNANYWAFYKLELINGPYGIYARDASHNYYDGLSTHDNYETGFQLEGASSNNTVANLDSYRNRDPARTARAPTASPAKKAPARATSCATPASGTTATATASSSASPITPANHVVRNCIAFQNYKKGFIDNGNPGALAMERNTAWKNGDTGYVMRSSSSTLKNNIGSNNVNGQATLVSTVKASGNSWNLGVTWTDSLFKSTDSSTLKGARGSDGRVVPSDFLVPASGQAIGATTRQKL
ncbi:unnamed protein product [Parascedosporium putredinis]|uniref:Pectate lyase n=1 Tax=Parascedosporium putredinis TaxID=1442378 RepID=A0A9P1GZX9_9PEZI|nr:unnamed protein product [Parascedosporium putredinis]CAI7992147.1 unnamed protein product [Parascedosporium putredinis]